MRSAWQWQRSEHRHGQQIFTVDHPSEIVHWCRVLNASTDQLRQAVKAVGSDPLAVQQYVMKARLSDSARGPR